MSLYHYPSKVAANNLHVMKTIPCHMIAAFNLPVKILVLSAATVTAITHTRKLLPKKISHLFFFQSENFLKLY